VVACAFIGNLKSVQTQKNKLMKIPFSKYHANGNDFILVLDTNFPKNLRVAEILSRLCSRHTGIGADGLFVISPSDNYDFFLDYYNADGSWETLCANGSRCAAKFMFDSGNAKRKLKFETGAGIHAAEVISDGRVVMSMKTPEYKSESLSPEGVNGFFVNSGARHFVCQSKNLEDAYVLDMGRKIRNSPEFQPGGINVNFYHHSKNNFIDIKTYEKGVEQVMLSCASGSAAVVFHLSQINEITSPVITCSAGGKLVFTFDDDWEKFWSEGPAEFIFKGKFDMAVLN
jgi:diaminopimelate epimerase